MLIVNCDDFGMHDAVNAGVMDSIENGVASSCSLMVPCPASANAMRLLGQRPQIPFGIHLALIRDLPGYLWGPAAGKAAVPSLLDPATGELYVDTSAGIAALLAQARLSDVERELRAQIEAVFDADLAPTHVDWHCLADGGRADIFDLGIRLAQEYGLAARVWLEEGREKASRQGKPVVDHRGLDSYSIGVHDKPATYARLLSELPPGLSEWAVHPGHVTEQWQAIEPSGWQVRQSDYEFLISRQAAQILDQEGITVIDYRALQQAWRP